MLRVWFFPYYIHNDWWSSNHAQETSGQIAPKLISTDKVGKAEEARVEHLHAPSTFSFGTWSLPFTLVGVERLNRIAMLRPRYAQRKEPLKRGHVQINSYDLWFGHAALSLSLSTWEHEDHRHIVLRGRRQRCPVTVATFPFHRMATLTFWSAIYKCPFWLFYYGLLHLLS